MIRSGRLLSVVALGLVILAGLAFVYAGSAGAVDYRMVQQEQLGEGIYIQHYELFVNGTTLLAKKLTVDLANPHLQIRAIHPSAGFNNRQTVRNMAAEQGAVAAVNADFFHLTSPAAPLGLHVEGGEVLSSPADHSWMGFGLDLDRVAHILNWRFRGEVITSGGQRHKLHGFNQTYSPGGIYLYDRSWGTEVSSVFFDDPVLQVTVRDGIITQILRTERSAAIPPGGYVVVADGIMEVDFLLRYARLGTSLDFLLNIEPDLQLDTAIGGQALLVKDGKPVDPSRLRSPGSTRASRTAVGAAGETIFFVTIDATPIAPGATMEELSVFMSRMGADQALNLDGGGSTTMVGRRPGEFVMELINQPRHGSERSLPNAIGVFNVAPRGAVSTLYLQGPEALLVGTEATYRVTGHDRHFHPVAIQPAQQTWEVSDPNLAEVVDGTLLAKAPGEFNLLVRYGGVTETKRIRVFGGADILDFSVIPERISLLPGQSMRLRAEVRIVSGLTLVTGPETIQWETDLGRVQNNTYYATEEGFGILRAEIDGKVQEVPIFIGGTRHPFFTFREGQTTSFRSHPANLPGGFEIQRDPAYIHRGEGSGRLDYDFSSDVDELMIAYGQLGTGQISMGSGNLGISAHVYGDGSGYWLRAEILDAGGTRRYVDLATAIDWEGWSRVQGEINPSWPQPLIFSSIYVVREPGHRAEGRPETGSIYIDYVETIKGLTEKDEGYVGSTALSMWVNSTQYELRGQPGTMDAAPFIESGRTFVPVRFMGEAFDAESNWTANPQTGQTERVFLETEDRLIILTVGEFTMIVVNKVTGTTETVEMDVTPRITGGRTYLPFRTFVEDGFGGRVDFSTEADTGYVDRVWVEG